jgi:hypothetical protein
MSDRNYDEQPSAAMPDEYDRLLGALDGLPDVTRTKPSTITVVPSLGVGGSTTYIVSTIRQRASSGEGENEKGFSRDYVFLQAVRASGAIRLVLPPQIADAIARQRDALTTKTRAKIGRASMEARKARGEDLGAHFRKLRGKRKAGAKK